MNAMRGEAMQSFITNVWRAACQNLMDWHAPPAWYSVPSTFRDWHAQSQAQAGEILTSQEAIRRFDLLLREYESIRDRAVAEQRTILETLEAKGPVASIHNAMRSLITGSGWAEWIPE